jgi:Conjugative transposon protein TcpC
MWLHAQPSASVSVTAMRWRERAPRIALVATCVVLSTVGLRTVLGHAARVPVRPLATTASSTSVDGFAEAFARSYLSFSPRDPDARDRRLRAFGFDAGALAADGDATPRAIVWSVAVASVARGRTGRVVTVLADDGHQDWYLAVTVSTDRAGRLSVVQPPAIVGSPAVSPAALAPPELEVDDSALKQVAERAVRHYLAGDRADLSADLAPRAAVTLPSVPVRVADVVSTTWVARPARLAVSVVAAARGGLRLTLRYELDVVRVAGRWLVRSVQVNPLDREDLS